MKEFMYAILNNIWAYQMFCIAVFFLATDIYMRVVKRRDYQWVRAFAVAGYVSFGLFFLDLKSEGALGGTWFGFQFAYLAVAIIFLLCALLAVMSAGWPKNISDTIVMIIACAPVLPFLIVGGLAGGVAGGDGAGGGSGVAGGGSKKFKGTVSGPTGERLGEITESGNILDPTGARLGQIDFETGSVTDPTGAVIGKIESED